jgi:hypothetical protein
MTSGLDAMVSRLTNKSGPTVLKQMDTSAKQIETNAVFRWPIGKPRRPGAPQREHSRDLIDSGSSTTSAGLVSFVVVPVDYAFYIKTNQQGLNGKSPWQELLRKPGIAEGKALAARCADDLKKLAGGK